MHSLAERLRLREDTRRWNYRTEDFPTSRLSNDYCPVSVRLSEAVTGVTLGKLEVF